MFNRKNVIPNRIVIIIINIYFVEHPSTLEFIMTTKFPRIADHNIISFVYIKL